MMRLAWVYVDASWMPSALSVAMLPIASKPNCRTVDAPPELLAIRFKPAGGGRMSLAFEAASPWSGPT